ncbi:unnamed protein product, partial [Ectocarpus sp. 4 AP-2014]
MTKHTNLRPEHNHHHRSATPSPFTANEYTNKPGRPVSRRTRHQTTPRAHAHARKRTMHVLHPHQAGLSGGVYHCPIGGGGGGGGGGEFSASSLPPPPSTPCPLAFAPTPRRPKEEEEADRGGKPFHGPDPGVASACAFPTWSRSHLGDRIGGLLL